MVFQFNDANIYTTVWEYLIRTEESFNFCHESRTISFLVDDSSQRVQLSVIDRVRQYHLHDSATMTYDCDYV